MPILLDQSISPCLVRSLRDVFPDLESVYLHSLTCCPDLALFEWARNLRYPAILSADRDLVRLVRRFGPPPKIIALQRSGLSARALELVIRREAARINEFLESPAAVLTLVP